MKKKKRENDYVNERHGPRGMMFPQFNFSFLLADLIFKSLVLLAL